MEKNNVIVIGAFGQDGSFMSEILLEKGYNVFGIVNNTYNDKLNKKVTYINCDFSDTKNIDDVILKLEPKQIYNFMGVSNVFDPWDNVNDVYEKNFLIPLKIIESIKNNSPKIKFLQASSSLVFGKSSESPQNENTKREPIYHYGLSKNFTDELIKLYRNKFNLFLCSAILYNHESERRGPNFFTKKLIKDSLDVKFDKKKFIELGQLNEYRDIGYAKDYAIACYMILNKDLPDDYIVSSGNSIKLAEIVSYVFEKLNLSTEKNLKINEKLKRNENLSHLIGDNKKLKKIGWSGTKNFKEIIDIMIENEIKNYR